VENVKAIHEPVKNVAVFPLLANARRIHTGEFAAGFRNVVRLILFQKQKLHCNFNLGRHNGVSKN